MNELELEILAYSLQNKIYRELVSNIFQVEDFSVRETKFIFNFIKSHKFIDDYVLPESFTSEIESLKDISDEFKESILKVLCDLYQYNIKAPQQSLDLLSKYKKKANCKNFVLNVVDLYEKCDYEKIEEKITTYKNENIPLLNSPINWAESPEERFRERENKLLQMNKVLPVAIPSIDQALCGGIRDSEFAIVVGNTNVGKSRFAINMTYNGLLKGLKVLHIITENALDTTMIDFDAKFLGVDSKILRLGLYSDEQYVDFINKFNSPSSQCFLKNLKVLSVPVRTSFAYIEAVVERNKDIDVIVIDSLDHIKCLENYKEYRLQQTAVYWEFFSLVQRHKLIGVSTTHAGKEWAGRVAGNEAVSESYDKARIAHIVITLSRDKKQMLSKPPELEVFLSKSRNSESNRLVLCQVDYSTSTFIEQKINDSEDVF